MALLELKNIVKEFAGAGGKAFRALDDVSVTVEPGECVAIVGESGSGKSTLARIALGLMPATSGEVIVGGERRKSLSRADLQASRHIMQPIFQDPGASFNPRRTVASSLSQALATTTSKKEEQRRRSISLLEQVGLTPAEDFLARYPHELSGGQRQRVAIARALAPGPQLVVADEPLSGADVSIRAQVLNLLISLARSEGLAYLMITHDMLVARAIAHRVVVMHKGRVVEQGLTEDVISDPKDAYTARLLGAVQSIDAVSLGQVQAD